MLKLLTLNCIAYMHHVIKNRPAVLL